MSRPLLDATPRGRCPRQRAGRCRHRVATSTSSAPRDRRGPVSDPASRAAAPLDQREGGGLPRRGPKTGGRQAPAASLDRGDPWDRQSVRWNALDGLSGTGDRTLRRLDERLTTTRRWDPLGEAGPWYRGDP